MSKYEIIRTALDGVVHDGSEINWDKGEMLFATLVTVIEQYAAESGNAAVADVLEFELSSLRSQVDTVFLRAR